MKILCILSLIAIGAGVAQAEINPKIEPKPEGKYVPGNWQTKAVETADAPIKVPKNAFDFPIRKGGEAPKSINVK
jgi:hypothetical protein